MSDMMQMIAEAYMKPDPKPYLFQIGQTVRVLNRVVDDGQTPKKWAGALCIVEKQMCSGLLKCHWYTLRHPSGAKCEFREEDLDCRYSRQTVTTGNTERNSDGTEHFRIFD